MSIRRPPANLLATAAGRRRLYALLYLSEGAPIGFVWWALPTLLGSIGIGLADITMLTTLATVPWILKFLAAPAIDAGLHRGIALKRWILTCQLGMAAALLPLALIDWNAQFTLVVAIIVAHAVFAAVQDVGIDTLAIHTVPRDELGRVNGWMQAGMLAGRAGVAAGSTFLAGAYDNPAAAVVFLALLIALPAIVLVTAVEEPRIRHESVRWGAVWHRVATRASVAGLVVALVIGAGFEFFGVSAGPRLVELGSSATTMTLFYGLLAPAGLALGALAGGLLTDRAGPLKSTSLSLAVLTVLLVSIASGDFVELFARRQIVWFVLAYVGIGALTAASYALFMTLSQGEFAATRFSLFMAMTNACEAWAGFVGGRFAEASYGLTLISLAIAACVAVVPLLLLGRAGVGGARTEPRLQDIATGN